MMSFFIYPVVFNSHFSIHYFQFLPYLHNQEFQVVRVFHAPYDGVIA